MNPLLTYEVNNLKKINFIELSILKNRKRQLKKKFNGF